MIGRLLIVSFVLVMLYMTLWFLAARRRQRLDTVDSAWGGGFAVIAWTVVVQQPSTRTLVAAVLVTIWSGRLTSHLAKRSSQGKEDPRYEEMAKKWKGNLWIRAYGSVFLLQGLIIWLVGLPLILNAGTLQDQWAWLTNVAIALWFAGFIFEAIADGQLARFRTDAANKGKNMDQGLWRYSRHPNYFGELVQWWAIGLLALQVTWGWVSLVGPLLLTILILFVSGVPPIEKKRQNNAEYQAYKRRTSVLIPLPPRNISSKERK